MLRTLVQSLCPGAKIPLELTSLRPGWLFDVHAIHAHELKLLEEARNKAHE